MDAFVELVKVYLVPGSISFLLIFMGLGVVLKMIAGPRSRLAYWTAAVLLILYLLLSLPAVALALEGGLGRDFTQLDDPASLEAPVEAIVLLGGGAVTVSHEGKGISLLSDASALRALETVRLYQALDDPLVVVSGGKGERSEEQEPESFAIQDALIALGIPGERIILESSSRNTYEQAIQLEEILEQEDIQRFVLVTSQNHMLRAVETFEKQGLQSIPSIAPGRSSDSTLSRSPFTPHPEALAASREAFREYMGLLYYWSRGWISLP